MTNQKNKGGAPFSRSESKREQQAYLKGGIKVTPETLVKVTYKRANILQWLQDADCEEVALCMAADSDGNPKIVLDQEKMSGFSKDPGSDHSFNFGCIDPPGCDDD